MCQHMKIIPGLEVLRQIEMVIIYINIYMKG